MANQALDCGANPTMILFNHGKEVERIVGATGKESIGRLIEKYARLEAAEQKVA